MSARQVESAFIRSTCVSLSDLFFSPRVLQGISEALADLNEEVIGRVTVAGSAANIKTTNNGISPSTSSLKMTMTSMAIDSALVSAFSTTTTARRGVAGQSKQPFTQRTNTNHRQHTTEGTSPSSPSTSLSIQNNNSASTASTSTTSRTSPPPSWLPFLVSCIVEQWFSTASELFRLQQLHSNMLLPPARLKALLTKKRGSNNNNSPGSPSPSASATKKSSSSSISSSLITIMSAIGQRVGLSSERAAAVQRYILAPDSAQIERLVFVLAALALCQPMLWASLTSASFSLEETKYTATTSNSTNNNDSGSSTKNNSINITDARRRRGGVVVYASPSSSPTSALCTPSATGRKRAGASFATTSAARAQEIFGDFVASAVFPVVESVLEKIDELNSVTHSLCETLGVSVADVIKKDQQPDSIACSPTTPMVASGLAEAFDLAANSHMSTSSYMYNGGGSGSPSTPSSPFSSLSSAALLAHEEIKQDLNKEALKSSFAMRRGSSSNINNTLLSGGGGERRRVTLPFSKGAGASLNTTPSRGLLGVQTSSTTATPSDQPQFIAIGEGDAIDNTENSSASAFAQHTDVSVPPAALAISALLGRVRDRHERHQQFLVDPLPHPPPPPLPQTDPPRAGGKIPSVAAVVMVGDSLAGERDREEKEEGEVREKSGGSAPQSLLHPNHHLTPSTHEEGEGESNRVISNDVAPSSVAASTTGLAAVVKVMTITDTDKDKDEEGRINVSPSAPLSILTSAVTAREMGTPSSSRRLFVPPPPLPLVPSPSSAGLSPSHLITNHEQQQQLSSSDVFPSPTSKAQRVTSDAESSLSSPQPARSPLFPSSSSFLCSFSPSCALQLPSPPSLPHHTCSSSGPLSTCALAQTEATSTLPAACLTITTLILGGRVAEAIVRHLCGLPQLTIRHQYRASGGDGDANTNDGEDTASYGDGLFFDPSSPSFSTSFVNRADLFSGKVMRRKTKKYGRGGGDDEEDSDAEQMTTASYYDSLFKGFALLKGETLRRRRNKDDESYEDQEEDGQALEDADNQKRSVKQHNTLTTKRARAGAFYAFGDENDTRLLAGNASDEGAAAAPPEEEECFTDEDSDCTAHSSPNLLLASEKASSPFGAARQQPQQQQHQSHLFVNPALVPWGKVVKAMAETIKHDRAQALEEALSAAAVAYEEECSANMNKKGRGGGSRNNNDVAVPTGKRRRFEDSKEGAMVSSDILANPNNWNPFLRCYTNGFVPLHTVPVAFSATDLEHAKERQRRGNANTTREEKRAQRRKEREESRAKRREAKKMKTRGKDGAVYLIEDKASSGTTFEINRSVPRDSSVHQQQRQPSSSSLCVFSSHNADPTTRLGLNSAPNTMHNKSLSMASYGSEDIPLPPEPTADAPFVCLLCGEGVGGNGSFIIGINKNKKNNHKHEHNSCKSVRGRKSGAFCELSDDNDGTGDDEDDDANTTEDEDDDDDEVEENEAPRGANHKYSFSSHSSSSSAQPLKGLLHCGGCNRYIHLRCVYPTQRELAVDGAARGSQAHALGRSFLCHGCRVKESSGGQQGASCAFSASTRLFGAQSTAGTITTALNNTTNSNSKVSNCLLASTDLDLMNNAFFSSSSSFRGGGYPRSNDSTLDTASIRAGDVFMIFRGSAPSLMLL